MSRSSGGVDADATGPEPTFRAAKLSTSPGHCDKLRNAPPASVARHEPDDPPARVMLEQQIDEAVGIRLDVADAAEPRHQRLPILDAVAVDDHAIELRRLERADEQV